MNLVVSVIQRPQTSREPSSDGLTSRCAGRRSRSLECDRRTCSAQLRRLPEASAHLARSRSDLSTEVQAAALLGFRKPSSATPLLVQIDQTGQTSGGSRRSASCQSSSPTQCSSRTCSQLPSERAPGSRLATGSGERMVRFWRVTPFAARARAPGSFGATWISRSIEHRAP